MGSTNEIVGDGARPVHPKPKKRRMAVLLEVTRVRLSEKGREGPV